MISERNIFLSMTLAVFIFRCSDGLNQLDRNFQADPELNISEVIMPSKAKGRDGQITFTSSREGEYVILTGAGHCPDGVSAVGRNISGYSDGRSAVTVILSRGQMASGGNRFLLCFLDRYNRRWTQRDFQQLSDESGPLLQVVPAGGASSSAIAVNASCDESCTIIYTLNGTDPLFLPDGSVGNGTVYSAGLSITSSATLKIISRDAENNVSAVQTFAYTVSAGLPTVTVNSVNENPVKFRINWQTDTAGEYAIVINGNCGAGVDGTISAGVSQNNNVDKSDLAPGSNTVRICSRAVAGPWGYADVTLSN